MSEEPRVAKAREVFFSHAGDDRKMADCVVAVLASYGVPVWYSPANIVGAQQWHDEIGRALARCDWFILLLTPAAVQSKWVKRELMYALQEERYEDRIAPVMCSACDPGELSWTLASYQIVDFTGNFEAGCRALLAMWGIEHQSTRP